MKKDNEIEIWVMVRVIVFNTNINNISIISWQSVLLVDETGVARRKPPTCHKSLINFITYYTSPEQDLNSQR
jgi:hypothetical protein